MARPPLSTPLPLAEAQQRLLGAVTPLAIERIPAADAAGRYVAEPLVAARTQPAADLSAMDGYAVRADDLAGPWRVVGESAAGHPFAGALAPREAVRISTGAMMPPGDGAVLLQEGAVRDGEALRLGRGDGPSARHIRRAGFDFAAGDLLLAAGTRIGPAELALALAAGVGRLAVRRLPRIAIVDSGDELAGDPADCAPHQVPASNGAMLAAMAAPLAREVHRIGPIPDRVAALLEALAQAGDADVVVTTGGVSVGDHDLVRPALEQWGAEIEFWRVAIKPGKPLLVARKARRWVLGLPGNPVSSYVTAFLFLLPLLRALAGSATPLPRALGLPLAQDLPAGGARREFLRARLAGSGLVPVEEADSSALRALSQATALIDRPANAAPARAGSVVPVYLLENGGIA